MIKTIFIIVVSVAVSASTTVLLLMRYSNTVVAKPETNKTAVEIVHDQALPRAIVDDTDDTHLQALVQKDDPIVVDNTGVTSKVAYFDYNKLNRDLEHISTALERFNGLMSREVTRFKRLKEQNNAVSAQSP